MDPLSVAASLSGLLSAANKITQTFLSLQDAPRLARSVTAEVTALSAIFAQLNTFLRHTTQRMSMTTVEQFVTTLTHCVLTFAELEEVIDVCMCSDAEGGGSVIGLWNRAKWTARQDTVKEILADLQTQKVSLNLMIGIWSSKTNLEAVRNYEQLCASMNTITERGRSRAQSINRNSKRLSLSNNKLTRRRSSLLSVVSLAKTRRHSLAFTVVSLDQPIHDSPTTTPPPQVSRRVARRLSWGGRQKSISLVTLVTSWWRPKGGMEISGPYDMRHTTHIGVDTKTGKMQVFGQEVGFGDGSPNNVIAVLILKL
ncbi:hypothetical protein BDD12DRAFT_811209 [Trichophaea hybrida]|nr:hypothetical protein BDD12DRAFT_811209 [Trichophaea hybrida]